MRSPSNLPPGCTDGDIERFAMGDDYPADIRRDDAHARRCESWRCPACGMGIGGHAQGCPEDDPEWAAEPADDDKD